MIKFMGDAALAFFDLQDPATSCNAALASAFDALKRLQCCSPRGVRLHAGIALHYGQAAYGNIGASQRLDFTLIGTDVNLVSRIQGVCSATGHRLILSERCARLLHPDCSTSMDATGSGDFRSMPRSTFQPLTRRPKIKTGEENMRGPRPASRTQSRDLVSSVFRCRTQKRRRHREPTSELPQASADRKAQARPSGAGRRGSCL